MQSDAPAAPHIPEYVDDRDLARLTPLARSQWQALRYEGGGPSYRKLGRRCVYKWADVVAWIDAQPSTVGRRAK